MTIIVKNLDNQHKERYPKLDESIPKPPFRIVFSAPSGGGKTTVLVSLFNKKNGYGTVFRKQDVIIFSSTLGLDDKFLGIPFLLEHAFDKFDPEIIYDIFEQQRVILKQYGRKKLPQILLIFEDMASEGIFSNSRLFEALAFKSRHLNISWIIITQKFNKVSTSLRSNINCLILFEPNNYSELDTIIEESVDKANRKKFRNMLLDVFKEPYAFLTICYVKGYPRYRRKFDEPLNIEDF